MQPIDYWKFSSELSVIQAALLIIGTDPADAEEYIETWRSCSRPEGYDATITALRNDILKGRLKATLRHGVDNTEPFYFEGQYIEGESRPKEMPDWHRTTIAVDDLKLWLRSKGIKNCFFFNQSDAEPNAPYLDKQHPQYAPKLAAAVEAWIAVIEAKEFMDSGTPKKHLEKWLRENAARYGLSDQDGNPNNSAIEEISKIANWNPLGGAGKTPIKSGEKQNPPTPGKN